MPIPNTFTAGEIASSQKVNENFAYVSDRIGSNSTASRLKLPGDMALGPRSSTQITAAGDSGAGSAAGYLQLSWNAELYLDNATYVVRRFNANEGAAAIRVGNAGISFHTTANTTGSLQDTLDTAMAIRPNKDAPTRSTIYVNPNYHFTAVPNATGEDIAEYRMTYVPLKNPYMLRQASSITTGDPASEAGAAILTSNAVNLGVPESAVAVHVHSMFQLASNATSLNGAGNSETGPHLSYRPARTGPTAFSGIFGRAGSKGAWSSMSGPVLLGWESTLKGQLVEVAYTKISAVYTSILGYYI